MLKRITLMADDLQPQHTHRQTALMPSGRFLLPALLLPLLWLMFGLFLSVLAFDVAMASSSAEQAILGARPSGNWLRPSWAPKRENRGSIRTFFRFLQIWRATWP